MEEFVQQLLFDKPEVSVTDLAGANTDFSEEMYFAIRQVYRGEELREDNWLRASSLGKPVVLQLLKKPEIQDELWRLGLYLEDTISEQTRLTFMTGHYFEALMRFQLQRFGWTVVKPPRDAQDGQWETSYNGIKGHVDIVVERHGVRSLVEVKTMSPTYFAKFMKQPDDSRGYVTQMALYQAGLGLDGYWLCLNKATGEIASVTPKQSDLVAALDRVDTIVPLMQEVKSLSDLEELGITAPEGEVEVYRRNPTGRLLVPQSMKYSPYRSLFYDITLEKNGYGKYTEYVGDYEDGETYTNHRDVATYLQEVKAGLQPPPTVLPTEED